MDNVLRVINFLIGAIDTRTGTNTNTNNFIVILVLIDQ